MVLRFIFFIFGAEYIFFIYLIPPFLANNLIIERFKDLMQEGKMKLEILFIKYQ